MRFSILLIGTLALVGVGCSKPDSSAIQASAGPAGSSSAAGTTAAPAIVGKPPEIDTTAVELLDAYQTDANFASKRFKGKFVLVFGTVGEIGQDTSGQFVTLPKNPDDVAKDAPKLRCLLKSPDKSSRKAGDKVDVAGTVDEVDGAVVLRDCVLDTQLRICQLAQKSLGKGQCEPSSDKLGARWSNGSDGVDMACQSSTGFKWWLTEWAAQNKDQTTRSKIAIESTSCRAAIEPVNIRLGVDLTVALTHIRWIDNTPTLVP